MFSVDAAARRPAQSKAGGAPMKITVRIPHVSWRDGRPRFNPGPKMRALGYRGEDLRHAGGAWFDLRETEDWIRAKEAEIAGRRARKAEGKRLAPIRKPGSYTLEDLFEDLYKSKDFGAKAVKTQADYRAKAKAFATFEPMLYAIPANELTRAAVKGLHERLWEEKGLAMANGMIAVLRLAYSHAIDRGRGDLKANPCLKLRLKTPEPRLRCATGEEIAALMRAADAHEPSIGDAIVIALFTGQRQGDVLALAEEGVAGGRVRLRQRKTGALVSVLAMPQLVDRLAVIRERNRATGRVAPTIVFDPRSGEAWNEHTFRHRFSDLRDIAAAEVASVASLRFQDLRDTAVTWLARAECTIPEIASVTGHSQETINTVLRHYLVLDETINDRAMEKLHAWALREGLKL
jgi:Phage integrase family